MELELEIYCGSCGNSEKITMVTDELDWEEVLPEAVGKAVEDGWSLKEQKRACIECNTKPDFSWDNVIEVSEFFNEKGDRCTQQR